MKRPINKNNKRSEIKRVNFVCEYRGNTVCDTICEYTANEYDKDTVKRHFEQWKEKLLSDLDFYLQDEN